MGGCVAKSYYPSVRLGIVEKCDAQNYELTVVDGIKVLYRSRLAQIFATIDIKVEGLLFFKMLVAQGNK